MLRTTLASSRVLRVCVFALVTITTAIVFTTDTADARRRHRQPRTTTRLVRATSRLLFHHRRRQFRCNALRQQSRREPPSASLTKIMTLYLLFERLDAGKMKLDTEMEVSEHASEQAPTKLGLRPGQTIRVEDAIKGLVTRSANDAAVVIAEAIAGDEDDFAKQMTRKARALGMTRTVYRNASGLPDDEQVTTARDQATLGRAIQDRFPRYYRYFSTVSIQLSRPFDPQPQSPARQCRGRRRHQDRLHPRLRLQSRDLDAPGQPPSGRRGDGRPQRRFA